MRRINTANLLLATIAVLLALNLAATFHPGSAQAGGSQYKVVIVKNKGEIEKVPPSCIPTRFGSALLLERRGLAIGRGRVATLHAR